MLGQALALGLGTVRRSVIRAPVSPWIEEAWTGGRECCEEFVCKVEVHVARLAKRWEKQKQKRPARCAGLWGGTGAGLGCGAQGLGD
jgi:hypothetical protein